MAHGKIYNNIVETVGGTPLVKLNRVSEGLDATIALKCEFFNPLGSVKDRIGTAMIEAAEAAGDEAGAKALQEQLTQAQVAAEQKAFEFKAKALEIEIQLNRLELER